MMMYWFTNAPGRRLSGLPIGPMLAGRAGGVELDKDFVGHLWGLGTQNTGYLLIKLLMRFLLMEKRELPISSILILETSFCDRRSGWVKCICVAEGYLF